ncbi:TonB-dependent receptor domain-containing protein [Sphingomonas sp. Leaf4]|uniref:TonB-dependent receptor domain-containing protein n=1 Tax=Sphingomonas sp. Leaf4 TaxID=2876553 RepID=UPI001E57D4AC|nr:TonB-dependent receptor [Sphingomonas sp. Leaf4]
MVAFRSRLLTTTVFAGAAIALTSPAQAQVAEPTVGTGLQQEAGTGDGSGDETIVVTGSRIQRRDLTSPSPIAVVSAEEFQLTGAINVEQVINTLPQAVPGTTGFSNNPGSGAATLNLRNLGATRTLVLVNGRRWMSYDTNQIVDLNTIPQFMLQNVEVLTGGQSATYGSDAIAGVVNFNLRQDLNGAIIGGQYALTEQGDGARYDVNFAVGSKFADGRGSVTVYANYTRREPIFQDARDFSRNAAGDGCIVPGSTNSTTGIGTNFGGALATCASRGGEVGLIPQGSASTPLATLPGITTGGASLGYVFNPTGGGTRAFNDPADLYNFAPDNYLMLPQERYLLGGYGSYELADNITGYTEVGFVKNSVPQELAPTPIGQALNLQIASPWFNEQTRGLLRPLDTDNDGYVTTNVNFRFNQSGPRNVDASRTAFRLLGGLRGNITDNLRFDVYYMYARTENQQYQQGNISRSRFAAATETEIVNGTLRCRAAAARTAGCVPLNVFGLGLADPAAIRYVTVNSTNLERSDIRNFVASVNGDLFTVGNSVDPVAFAAGVEYRGMSASYRPDTFLSSGDVAGFNAGQPTSGEYDVREVFGELRVPLVSEGFIHKLELTGNARYSDYSLDAVGGVWTYAGGAQLSPIRDITLRGQYARAVRAPNVQDLFGGNSTGFPAAQDPCSDRGAAGNRTEAVRQLCIANGVPAANVFTRAVQPNAQIQANFGGDPNLSEETSDTYTAGVVFRPSFIPRLNVTVDYFNIKVEDTIATFGGGLNDALSLCFTVAQNLTNPICSIFQGVRNTTTGAIGETSGGRNPNVLSANIATLKTSGIDVAADYSLPVDFSVTGGDRSNVSVSFLGTYLDKFRSTSVAAIPERETIGEGSVPNVPTLNPMPKWVHTARLSVSDGPMVLSLRWRYRGPVKDRRLDNTFVGLVRTPQDPALFPNARIGAVNYFDLSTAFKATDRLQITIGVNNLTNQKPEVLGSLQEQANTFPGTYDVLGRDFFVGARLQF